MSTNQKNRLETFVEQIDGTIDNLSFDERERLEMKLKKADTMKSHGLEDRAEELREETAESIGGKRGGSNTDNDADVLARTLRETLSGGFTLDDLQVRHKREKRIDVLEQKKTTFERRDMDDRAAELGREIKALEAVGGEIANTGGKYDDVDTLAKRATRDGFTLSYTDDGLESRKTGGSTVTLAESGPNEYNAEPRVVDTDSNE